VVAIGLWQALSLANGMDEIANQYSADDAPGIWRKGFGEFDKQDFGP
jgi:hypothetical protein